MTLKKIQIHKTINNVVPGNWIFLCNLDMNAWRENFFVYILHIVLLSLLSYYATVAVTTSGNWYFYAKKALLYIHSTSHLKKAIFPNRKNCFTFIRACPLVRVKYTVHFHSNVLFCNFCDQGFCYYVHRILKGGPSPLESRILTAKISWQVT